MPLTVHFESSLPSRKVREYCEAHPERVAAICYDSGYATESGFAYDVMLRKGWSKSDDAVHTLIEQTASEILRELKNASPCDCERCSATEGSE